MTIEPLPNSNNVADTPQGAPFKVSELQLPEMHLKQRREEISPS